MDHEGDLTADGLPTSALSFVTPPGATPEWLAAEMAATHGPVNGQHSHSHPAYGSQGDDKNHDHLHAHAGDSHHGHDHSMKTPARAEPPAEPPADESAAGEGHEPWTAAGHPELGALLAGAYAAVPDGGSLVAAAMEALGSPWGVEQRGGDWALLGRDGEVGTFSGDDGYGLALDALREHAFADQEQRPVLAQTWRSDMAFEGVKTPDGRQIDPGGFAYRDCPMPMMLQTTTDMGHYGAVLAGTILSAGTQQQVALGSGEYDDTEAGRYALQIVEARGRFGVSIDGMSPVDAEAEIECDDDGWCSVVGVIFHLLTIGGVTMTPWPAFPDAYIALEQRAQSAAGDPETVPVGEAGEPCAECVDTPAADPARARAAGGHVAAGKEEPAPAGKAPTVPFTAAANTHFGSIAGCQCRMCVAAANGDPAATAADSANRATGNASSTGSHPESAPTATGSSPTRDANPSGGAVSALLAMRDEKRATATDDGGPIPTPSDGTPSPIESTEAARTASGLATSPTTGSVQASSSTAPRPNDSLPSRMADAPSAASGSLSSQVASAPSRALTSTTTTDESESGAGSAHTATGASGVSLTRQTNSGRQPTTSTDSLTAAGEFAHLATPPAEWFGNPKFAVDDGRLVRQPGGGYGCPLSVTADGEVYGHMATWQNCHTGYQSACVTPPRSKTGYAGFMLRPLMTADGEVVHVGHLTMGCGHAPTSGRQLSADEVRAHYDGGPGAVRVAQVCVGEDQFGIWFHGSVDPAATPEQVREFAACSVSGDWREVWRGKGLDLVACLAGVTVPGFPVASALAAAGLHVVARDDVLPSVPVATFTDGRPAALVAAGVIRRPLPWESSLAAAMGRIDRLEERLAHAERVTSQLRPLAASAIAERVSLARQPASNGSA